MKKIKPTQNPTPAKSSQTPAATPQRAESKWMKQTDKILPMLLVLATIVVLGVQLFSQEWEMLYRSQELSLFIPNRQFYEGMTIYPGGTLQWLACWATQFFYHPATGVMLLCAFWLGIVVVARYVFRLRGWYMLFTLPVIILLMTAIVQSGYWIYYTKLQGYLFVPTLGILISLVAAAVYRLIERRFDPKFKSLTLNCGILAVSLLWMVAFAWKGYQYLGAWSFLGVGLMMLPASLNLFFPNKENAANPKGMSAIAFICPIVIGILCLYFVPHLAYDSIYGQTQIDTIYQASMPSFQYSQTDNDGMRGTYYVLFLMFLPLVACMYYHARWQTQLARWSLILNRLLLVLVVIGGPCYLLCKQWYHNDNFQKEMQMNRLIEEGNWQGALNVYPSWTESDTLKQPTRTMVMMKNLALFRLGREGDDMLNYLEGAREQRMDSLVVRMTQVGGKLLYFNYGKLNFCYRWCMEDGVEFGWKVEHLKLMARCALLKGEWKAAQKYLNLLKQTRYHRDWAKHYEAYVGHPNLMEQDPDLAPICKLKEFGNRLDGDNTLVELYLLRTFSNGHGADPIYQRATLMCALIMKDIDLFWPRLREYIYMHQKEPNFRIPRHYQEAAYLYCMLEPGRPSELWPGFTNAQAAERLPFDQSVKKSYQDFMNFNSRPEIAPLPESQKRIAFQPMFGNTFYYFYFLIRGQKTN